MSLTFEKILTLEPGQSAKQLFLGQEHDGMLYSYFATPGHEALDQHTDVPMSDYDNLEWSPVDKNLTTDRVDTIGIKTFPRIGAYGFWTMYGEDRSKILAPVHIQRDRTTPPTFSYSINGSKVSLSIKQPKDVRYDCFRVVFRDDLFAFEFITYELTTTIDVKYTGDYLMYITGYLQEGATVSEDSEQVPVHIEGIPYNRTPAVDKYVKDAKFSDTNVLTLDMSDNTQLQASNLANTLDSLRFTGDGKLQITFKDGSTLTSSNGLSPGSSSVNLLSEDDMNLSNYVLVPSSIPQFENTYNEGANTLVLTGGEGHDRCYRAITVTPNTDYKLTFSFASPTGFSCSYGSSTQYFFVSAVEPNNSNVAAANIDKLGASASLNSAASDTPENYSIIFNSGSRDVVYFVSDFGYLLDGTQVTILLNDIALYEI